MKITIGKCKAPDTYNNMNSISILPEKKLNLVFNKDENKFTRKPFKKNLIRIESSNDWKSENDSITSSIIFSNFNQRKSIETPKFVSLKSEFGSKLHGLVELGLTPDIPFAQRHFLKHSKSNEKRIKISDFMRKSVKKQITSSDVFKQKEEFVDGSELKEKSKIPLSLSQSGFLRKGSLDLKYAKSHQTLPPIISRTSEGLSTKKSSVSNLIKIDKILEDCDVLLKTSKSGSSVCLKAKSIKNNELCIY